MTSPEKILKNKTGALYFAPLVGAFIVFFFILFSFGVKHVDAAILFSQDDKSTLSGPSAGVDFPFVPTASGEITKITFNSQLNATSGFVDFETFTNWEIRTASGGGGSQVCNLQAFQPLIGWSDSTDGGLGIPPNTDPPEDIVITSALPYRTISMVPTPLLIPGCDLVAGNTYYMRITLFSTFVKFGGDGSIPYFIIESDGIASGVEIDTPVDSFIYPSNPIAFSGTYSNGGTYDQLQVQIQSNTIPQSLIPTVIALPPISAVDQPWSFNRSLPFFGAYTIRARLWDSALATGTPFTSDVNFVLGTTATTSTTTQSNLPGDPTPIDCGTFDIGCYLKNFIVWAFWPDEQIITQFQNLTLRNTFPFAYAYEAVDMVQILANPDTMASTSISVHTPIGDLTFLNKEMLEAIPLSGTVKSAIEICTWILCVLYCYRRTLGAHDTNTTTS